MFTFIYVGLAMVTGGVLPHDEVAGVETILPAAQAILPGWIYKAFMTADNYGNCYTLNSVFNECQISADAGSKRWMASSFYFERKSVWSTIHYIYLYSDCCSTSNYV